PRLASCSLCFLLTRRPPRSTLFPYTTSSDLIVVLQQVLADVVVARFDLLLRLLQRLVHPGVNDGLAFLEAQAAQHGVHALRPEDAHEVVFQREEELGGAGVALAARAAAQLVVDAPAFVALRAQDEKA